MNNVFDRFEIFSANLEKIIAHNAAASQSNDNSVTLAVNQFADLTNTEYRELLGLKTQRVVSNNKSVVTPPCMRGQSTLDNFDWNDKGVVLPVKDQGQCGSCWSFSATAPIESAIAIASKSAPVALSEQFLVDCCKGSECGDSEGCNGGFMQSVYRWYATGKYGAPALESGYKYTGRDGQCKTNTPRSDYNVTGLTVMSSTDDMDAAIQTGPISVAIDAGGFAFQFYSKGVIAGKSCQSSELNHGVVVTGYGTEGGVEYWKIRNSWGASWGEKGSLKVQKSVNCLNVETFDGSDEEKPNSIPLVSQ